MSDVAALAESLHPHEAKVLAALAASTERQGVTEEVLAEQTELQIAQVGAALGRLQLKKLVSVISETTEQKVSLTKVGKGYLHGPSIIQGPPIVRIVNILREANSPLPTKDIQFNSKYGTIQPHEWSTAIGELKKENVIRFVSGGQIELTGESSQTADLLTAIIHRLEASATRLSEFSSIEQELIDKFSQKRGKHYEPFRIDERTTRTYSLTEIGKAVNQQILVAGTRPEIGPLTPEMLKNRTWEFGQFRKYTIGLKPERKSVGKKHPYREFLDLVKTKLTAMGFEEMRGGLVENEFWNMDALFMPQFHPARETHDVYFVKEPGHSAPIREPFLSQVAQAHENGGKTGSSGWNYTFDRMRTRRLVLRSQGTAVSARTLAASPKVPGKYFSIARCFRYDQVDATHAPDFFQIEGIVLGPDINFRTLLGLLTLFAREVAQAQEIRFAPAYFPFTEPSVELHVRHPRLGWIELGGAGLFRPEVTRPLGIEVPVIAWGLGLDRMAMVALEIHDIRDLFSGDLEMIRSKRVQY